MSNHESGHYKNITALESLIAYVNSLGASYNPSNENLTIPGLNALYEQAKQRYRLLSLLSTDFNNAVGERILLFAQLKPYATQIASSFKVSSKANAEQHADILGILHKIRGVRASAHKKQLPLNPETTPPNSISTSQQSYDMRFDYFQKLFEAVTAESSYNPNEAFLKPAAIQHFTERLQAANSTVAKAFEDVRNGRIARDTIFYGPSESVYTIQAAVKEYIKSAFKASSTAYKQAVAIRFTKPAKKYLKLNA